MATPPLDAVVRYLHRSFDSGSPGHSDGDLLARFTADCEPTAFEELVRRYEAMVMNVCRRLLGDGADADDVFQATFFLLARKARSIRRRDSVGCWLHGVAHRLSCQLLSKMAVRRRGEGKLRQVAESKPAPEDPAHQTDTRELAAVLDDELRNLPTACRAAVVACHLQGLSTAAAARQLGVPLSTFKSRLQRGRVLLRKRLERRGFGLSSVALAAVLAEQSRAGATAALVHVTIQAALCVAASGTAAVATRAGSLASKALRSGAGKARVAAWAVLGFALVGLSVAFSTLAPTGPAASPVVSPHQVVAPANQVPKQAGLDKLGDPLPPGAALRLGTTRWHQPWGVAAVAFAQGGKRVVSAGGHTLRVWDAATGKQERLHVAYNIFGLAVSPAGDVLVGAQNGNFAVWDLATGKLRFERQSTTFAVAISPDGTMLATAGRTSKNGDPVILWDLRTGDKLRTLPGNMYQVFHLAFSPDGKTLAAVSCKDSSFAPPKSVRPEYVRLWDVATGKLQELEGHKGGATSVAFSRDGTLLATAGHDGIMILWDTATRKPLRKIELVEEPYLHRKGDGFESGGILDVAFAPDGKTLATANHDGTIRLFETATGKQLRVLRGHANSVRSVAFAPDGKVLASGSADQTICLWDPATGTLLNPRPGHDGDVETVLVSPDGKRAFSAGRDRTLRVWDLTAGQELLALRDFKSAIASVALSLDGKLLAVGRVDGLIQLHDAVSGAVVRELKGHTGSVRSLSFSPDSKVLASASPSGKNSNLTNKETDRSLRLWEVGTGQELPRIQGNRNDWYAFISPDGKWLAAYDGNVVLWEPATGKKLRSVDKLTDFAFHPDGKKIVGWWPAPREFAGGAAGGNEKGKVQVRSLADGAEIYSFDGPERPPLIGGLFVLSPDARLVAMAVSKDGGFEQNVLQLWEMATGKLRRTLQGHGGGLTGCAFSPDGRTVLTASADSTILVWDLTASSEPQPKEWTPKALESLWDDLGAADAVRADLAIRALVTAGQQALPFLQKHLPPAPAARPEWRAWVKDLGSEQFAVRDKASRALEALAEQAYPLLQEALANPPSLEVRQRLERLLDPLKYPLKSAKAIRELRGVEVLERIGTAQARQVLEGLARGEPGARLTEEARLALARLAGGKAP
jgi:RNA polymerase sigma factor (sigma-70 family)